MWPAVEGTFHSLICSHGDKGVHVGLSWVRRGGRLRGRKQERVRFQRCVSITGRWRLPLPDHRATERQHVPAFNTGPAEN